tara:strand:+ start:5980 stop:6393 length:414 start_codon:yes stop_codon:yes gene_type:complete
MARIALSTASLRFFGHELDPDDLTRRLAGTPTKSAQKGDIRTGQSDRQYIEKTGSWRLKASDAKPGDLNAQIQGIFASLTPDLSVWLELSARFRADIFCGLFMDERNEGLEITPETLRAMGERGVTLSLDIYDPAEG